MSQENKPEILPIDDFHRPNFEEPQFGRIDGGMRFIEVGVDPGGEDHTGLAVCGIGHRGQMAILQVAAMASMAMDGDPHLFLGSPRRRPRPLARDYEDRYHQFMQKSFDDAEKIQKNNERQARKAAFRLKQAKGNK